MSIRDAARDYVDGWDSWDCIVDTARLGLATEDRYQLQQVFAATRAEEIGREIVELCRARVETEGRETK